MRINFVLKVSDGITVEGTMKGVNSDGVSIESRKNFRNVSERREEEFESRTRFVPRINVLKLGRTL